MKAGSVVSGPPPAESPEAWADLYGRSSRRATLKKQKDLDRWQRLQERTLAYETADRIIMDSPGEIVATRTLRLVEKGDVLQDAKQRPYYKHPQLHIPP